MCRRGLSSPRHHVPLVVDGLLRIAGREKPIDQSAGETVSAAHAIHNLQSEGSFVIRE